FFSSRRRHTSFSRDWSSDVCSSDLWHSWPVACLYRLRATMKRLPMRLFALVLAALALASLALQASADDRQTFVLVHGATAGGWRTEERRVGKRGRNAVCGVRIHEYW